MSFSASLVVTGTIGGTPVAGTLTGELSPLSALPDPVLDADFLGGAYIGNSAPVASAQDLFGVPSGFPPVVVIAGSGMEGAAGQFIADPYNTAFRGSDGYTLLVEFSIDASGDEIVDVKNNAGSQVGLYMWTDSGGLLFVEYYDGANSFPGLSNPQCNIGSPNRLVVTKRPGFVDVALNGGAVETFAANTVADPAAWLSEFNSKPFYRRVTAWEPLAASEISTISMLP